MAVDNATDQGMPVQVDAATTTPASGIEELTTEVEAYRQAHPEIDEAMRIFEISDHAYEEALQAMYGPQISWNNSTNPSEQFLP